MDSAAPAKSIPDLVACLSLNVSDEDKVSALTQLSKLLEASSAEDGEALCEYLRLSGVVAALTVLLSHPSPPVYQWTLLLLGNLCSDSVDRRGARRTRKQMLQMGTFRAVARHLWSSDRITLTYAEIAVYIVSRRFSLGDITSKGGRLYAESAVDL
jgi:hypothetical protein